MVPIFFIPASQGRALASPQKGPRPRREKGPRPRKHTKRGRETSPAPPKVKP
ncbi:hypothetical protein HMPREF3198_02040 [Winkia neuii]|nr:hypothetical protein HMPREF3198_02040 [Winkia neuii]